MQPLSCQRCGAALTVPDDLSAMVVRCQFCGEQTPLPQALLALRAQERQLYLQQQAQAQARASAEQTTKRAARSMWLFVGLILGGPLLLTLGIFVFIYIMTKTVQESASAAASAALATPIPTVVVPDVPVVPTVRASDPKSTGEDRMTVLMKQLYEKGCRNVIMAPVQASGEETLKASFVVNGTCVRVLTITGVAENKLTLTMKTPFGETIPTPPAGVEVDFTYCPKTPGPHPMSIVPATDDFYTVAAVECPASLSKKK